MQMLPAQNIYFLTRLPHWDVKTTYRFRSDVGAQHFGNDVSCIYVPLQLVHKKTAVLIPFMMKTRGAAAYLRYTRRKTKTSYRREPVKGEIRLHFLKSAGISPNSTPRSLLYTSDVLQPWHKPSKSRWRAQNRLPSLQWQGGTVPVYYLYFF